jgi:hypothetical protein
VKYLKQWIQAEIASINPLMQKNISNNFNFWLQSASNFKGNIPKR